MLVPQVSIPFQFRFGHGRGQVRQRTEKVFPRHFKHCLLPLPSSLPLPFSLPLLSTASSSSSSSLSSFFQLLYCPAKSNKHSLRAEGVKVGTSQVGGAVGGDFTEVHVCRQFESGKAVEGVRGEVCVCVCVRVCVCV